MLTKVQQSQPPIILVVDDDTLMRSTLKSLLEKQGYYVILAENGIKALEKIQQYTPDLILMDAAMPIMDGFITSTKLKKIKSCINVPIIMITSLDDEQSVNKAFKAGAMEYITKPIHWGVLRNRVNIMLRTTIANNIFNQIEILSQNILKQTAIAKASLT